MKIFGTEWLQRLSGIFVPPVNSIVQVSYTERSDNLAMTQNIPFDNTKPQITEGDLIFDVNFTPKKIGNFLLVESQVSAEEVTNTGNGVVIALFQDNANDAIVTSVEYSNHNTAANNGASPNVSKKVIVSSLSAINFKVRASAGSNAILNELRSFTSGNLNFGNTIHSWIKITEIQQ